jgi:ketosteroid isomerase-like protein
MATSDFDQFVEQFQASLDEFFTGNAEPAKSLMSHREDVTLANPFGPIARGWREVEETMDRAALNYREGTATGFETAAQYVTPELAYTVWVERFRAKLGAGDEVISGALRRTTIFRRESQAWRIAHTHADPITMSKPPESLIPTQ